VGSPLGLLENLCFLIIASPVSKQASGLIMSDLLEWTPIRTFCLTWQDDEYEDRKNTRYEPSNSPTAY
jgi:hypothetical protein